MTFQRGDKMVEAIERFRIECARGFVGARPNPVRERLRIHVVEPDDVDAEFCEARRDLVGVVGPREVRAETEVHAEESNAVLPAYKWPSLPGVDEPVLAGGSVGAIRSGP